MAPMDAREIIDTQRQDWNRVAPGWEKWDHLLERNFAFVNHRLLGDARIRAGQRVLDLGCGTGFPALLAAQAVGPGGHVLGLDLAEYMLAVARRKAEGLQLKNVDFQAADVSTLTAGDAAYDTVISRFCLMFLPNVQQAVKEIVRVLKPGGYVAAAVWSAPENSPFLKIPLDVLKTMIELPPPDPEQPGIFRLAAPGDLAQMMTAAGLQGLAEEEVKGDAHFESVSEYFASLMDQAAPLQNLFGKLSSTQQRQAEQQIKEAAARYAVNDGIALPIAVRHVVGRKPR